MNKEKSLNVLLSSYQVFYQNLRNFHWTIRGPLFFELHAEFENLYTIVNGNIDVIAERIVGLDYTPNVTYSQYVEDSIIEECGIIKEAMDMACEVRDNLDKLNKLIKEKLMDTVNEDEADFDGVSFQMFLKLQTVLEKYLWMYTQYTSKMKQKDP